MAAGSTPRVVLLTAGNPYGLGVARRLAERHVTTTVLLQCDAAMSRCFTRRGWQRVVELPMAIARSFVRRRRAWRWRQSLHRFHAHVVMTGARNSPRMRADLARLAPDLLVLAGIGLVDEALLSVPRWGTLNGHPGLLPWARGNGVVAHAIAREVAVGASVHHVDAGIDRGPVVARRLLAVDPATRELRVLESGAVALAAELLAEVVQQAATTGMLPAGRGQDTVTPLCRWMDAEDRRRVEDLVRDGAAQRLFARWSTRCRPSAPPWDLPPELPSS